MRFYRKPAEDVVPGYVNIIHRAPDLYYTNISESVNSSVTVRQQDGQLTYIPTAEFATTGSNELIGTQIISGSLQLSGSVYINGHKQYNYGQFYDLNTQSGSSGSIQSMQIRTTDLSNGVSIVSGSQIKVENAGVYNLQFSAQLENTANTNIVFYIWFAKNGENIPNSNTHVDVAKAQSAHLGKQVASWNFIFDLEANDYVQIKWSSDNNGGILHYDAGTPSIPGTPSVITTITQIA
jgi:hypothetical protein